MRGRRKLCASGVAPAGGAMDNCGFDALWLRMAPGSSPPAPRLSVHGLHSTLAGPYDFTLTAGACAAVSGPSGSGKSLFLRMIADLDPNHGEARLDGRARGDMTAPDWRRRVPYVAADAGWWLDAVADHFAPERREQARGLARRLGLVDGQFDGPVARLSTGEQQRLALIRALVLDSPALLLDEPTSALDPQAADRVEALLRERLQAGCAILIVTHDAAQAARLDAERYQMADRRLERRA
jgi:ABC-type iron transport system FetAB ATPase subunit